MLKLHHMNLLNEIQETTLMMNLYQQQQLQQQQQQLQQQQALPAEIHPGSGIFRLRVGPTRDKQQAQQWLNRLRAGNFPSAFFANSNLCS